MCGIVGYIGKRDAAPILMEGLHRLEYRGYDSAGIAVVHSGELRLAKCKGRVRELERLLPTRFKGSPGIAHTRWRRMASRAIAMPIHIATGQTASRSSTTAS
jgi:glutamine---fructose-6-phosphate transaminase (isomerizing)